MKFDSITMKDIAKALNISKSTVSRALHDFPDIGAETKKIILEYAKKNNYRPNLMASSLKEGKSYSIGVVVSEIANPFFSQVIDGIESVAYENGYRVIITQSRESPEREIINVEQLCSHSIDGLLISLSSATFDVSHLKKWQDKGLPIVFFDKVAKAIKTHSVTANNQNSAFKATEYLIQRGYKNIAHITSLPFISTTVERLSGYKKALKKHDLPFNNGLVKYIEHGENIVQEVEDALRSLFEGEIKPEAILCTTDRTTISCYEILGRMKETIGDIGLAGFSNNRIFNYFSNIVCVVYQPAFAMGEAAMQLLLQIINSKTSIDKFEKKILETDLVVKEN